jgi:outer membrane lipoprotein SlyB
LLIIAELALAAPAFADSSVTYTYDALGRLVRSVSSGTSSADTSYTLDPAGNRSNVTVTGGGPALPSFSVNSVSVGEGAGTATLTVTKSGTASGTLSVNFASSGAWCRRS